MVKWVQIEADYFLPEFPFPGSPRISMNSSLSTLQDCALLRALTGRRGVGVLERRANGAPFATESLALLA